MKHVTAVIGANYGDEGKGLVTDYLCSDEMDLVVRFNGGAQAGHTVVTPEGRRHVFHHFSSGSFRGAATFLSKFFILNPIVFVSELLELGELSLKPKIFVDKDCLVTTPWDMLLNQAFESLTKRCGSCGLGINETMVRSRQERYALRFEDLMKGLDWIRQRLRAIREEYIPVRAHDLGVELSKQEHALSLSEGMMEHFLYDLGVLIGRVRPATWDRTFVRAQEGIVFEGAQGLRLDMSHSNYPYVTHSKTGLPNIVALMKQAEIKDALSVYYVTRTYMTRHGAGPLPHEIFVLPYPEVTDPTNVTNPHQGMLRYGWLDYDHLLEEIRTDLSRAKEIRALPSVAITCMDQIDNDQIQLVRGGRRSGIRIENLVKKFYDSEILSCVASYGPTRDHFQEF
jgi:adenylosuccinate synthase